MTNHHQNGLKQPQQQPPPPHEQVVVVMVPFPAQGHLNQLLQLSRLFLSYDIPVHYVGTATHNRQAKLRVHGWNPLAASNIRFHDFEIPPFISPLPDPNAALNFPSHLQPCFDAAKHLNEPVAVLLRALSSERRRVIVIHDSLMGSVIHEARFLPNVESYSFHSVSAFTVYLYIWETMQRNDIETSDVIPEEIPSLEGCFTAEFMDSVASEYAYHRFNSGNVYNTSRVIESAYMELLDRSTEAESIKNWALGPFNPVTIPKKKKGSATDGGGRHFCLEWLDKQEPNSVVYVSFGTTTAMNDEQITELAIGLKRSHQKFIWVLRDADKGDVFDGNRVRGAELPKGYEDSIKDKGLVVRDWAPQLEILAHTSTGGFVSHCGWNSCIESITMGVPIGAWPMHSDQPRNTVLVTQLLKVGIVVKDWSKRSEIVRSDRIEKMVKTLMASEEGDEMRKRAGKMGGDVRRSMEEGGASRMEIDSFVAHITRVG